ncbi:hypothetical protein SAMN05216187_102224 [Jeotgalicoccus aerolatus]|uniref:Uncharacterized protein n=1 Tax=Jeotgalicoccus aerolatus TaxID=709510 RepID=A0A1G8WEV1_9STAP|nr:hypothetical protein [Jeotgalicoccus aerolatus]SDJ76686.1 hypothetical protein SAMN05216187_102224 [Jeotgalicoccus aerolatus]
MFEWIVMFLVVETGIQPLVHTPSGRKLVISRLYTSQADANWLSTACAHPKRTQIGYQPLVHLTSGRKLVIRRLCTSQADANWLSTACAHLKRATTTQQNKKAPEPAQILRDFSAF